MAPKKIDLSLVNGTKEDSSVVAFYCYKKSFTFSLPAYELNDSGKFKLTEKGERIPLYEITDPDKGIKRRVRKTFEFSLMPNITKQTEHGKTVEYKCVFALSKENVYFDDLLKFLTAESKKGESSVWSSEEFNKNEHPEAYVIAEKMSTMKDGYEAQLAALKEENERLKKGK